MPYVAAAEISFLEALKQKIIPKKIEKTSSKNISQPRSNDSVRSKPIATQLQSIEQVPHKPIASPSTTIEPIQVLPNERKLEIDAYADSTPAHVTHSVAALAGYLSGVGFDDKSRARVLYRWVTKNIDYDAEGFFSGKLRNQSVDFVLKNRLAVCQGYAQLVESIGKAMGLDIHVVTGWSKGYGYTPGQTFVGQTNHAWNAVQIDGQWRLMDPTWGAGYLDERNQFVKSFQEHYLFTPPDIFIIDHLPQNSSWQLLLNPISSEQYADLVFTKPAFWRLGFRLGDHKHVRITAPDRTTINLELTQNVRVAAKLINANTNITLNGNHTLAQVSSSDAKVDVVFPKSGEYILRLFANEQDVSGPLNWVMDYRITAHSGAPESTFPNAYDSFTARQVTLIEPLTGLLKSGTQYRFHLRVPDAVSVAVVTNGIWKNLTKNEDEWIGEVAVTLGNPTVFAKFKSTNQFVGLLAYTSN